MGRLCTCTYLCTALLLSRGGVWTIQSCPDLLEESEKTAAVREIANDYEFTYVMMRISWPYEKSDRLFDSLLGLQTKSQSTRERSVLASFKRSLIHMRLMFSSTKWNKLLFCVSQTTTGKVPSHYRASCRYLLFFFPNRLYYEFCWSWFNLDCVMCCWRCF